MKKFVLLSFIVLWCSSLSSCDDICEHKYELIDSNPSTCIESGYELYKCADCAETMVKETSYADHIYADNYACHDRKCETVGCTSVEKATTEHRYDKEYVCENCNENALCTLQLIGEDFSESLLKQAALNSGTLIGDYEIVVLDAEATINNIENYIFLDEFDKDKIVAGLFVKFDVTFGGENTLFTIYYNFGLQFSEEQSKDISVTYEGSAEVWELEVVEGNKTILFEYSIT